jgi:hypothetical protein
MKWIQIIKKNDGQHLRYLPERIRIMAKVIKKKTNIKTVGELINALKAFSSDMPVCVGMDDEATVYQAKPTTDEYCKDKRGYVQVDGEDPWKDDA